MLGELTVSPVGDGMIEVAQLTGPNGKPKRWREVAPMTFLEENGQEKLIFKPDQNGRMQMILPYPFFVGQRVGLLENTKLLLPVVAISLLLMLLTLVVVAGRLVCEETLRPQAGVDAGGAATAISRADRFRVGFDLYGGYDRSCCVRADASRVLQ